MIFAPHFLEAQELSTNINSLDNKYLMFECRQQFQNLDGFWRSWFPKYGSRISRTMFQVYKNEEGSWLAQFLGAPAFYEYTGESQKLEKPQRIYPVHFINDDDGLRLVVGLPTAKLNLRIVTTESPAVFRESFVHGYRDSWVGACFPIKFDLTP